MACCSTRSGLSCVPNFKNKSFQNLGTVEAKRKQVFRSIFPDVSKKDIPSPYKNIMRSTGSPVTPGASIATPLDIFETIMDHNNNEPGFAAAINDILGNVVQTAKNENIPLNKTSQIAFWTAYNPQNVEQELFDPPLFPITSVNLPPSSDSLMGYAWDTLDTTLTSAQSVSTPDMLTPQTVNDCLTLNVCFSCLSNNIFKTTGSGAQIDVCGSCHSTDVLYGIPCAPVEELLASNQPLDVFMGGADSGVSDTVAIIRAKQDVTWNVWTAFEDGTNAASTDNDEKTYSDVDTLFEL
ncbi:hypothetical protein BU25DRAFT_420197 [Macroventuria anomochaeta]|uniref:Uncharacterized protein n=1 Tax=Macroventuria anomochaeta TaxID=301207 RepID=A0ACB6S5U6_9PLEO|nr:uncharacterized protein BU25DRAFT_420197 [Macroventuria anomochaeta]KAF2629338.1 hypothetical protein BU25DRAFT_420197 [Macroventuria anomochaeta]